MPLPKKRVDENKNDFIRRCMEDDVAKREFPSQSQRFAVCSMEANKTNVKV